MARVKDWIMGMEEDATWMSRAVFVNVHGIRNADIWDRANGNEDDRYPEPDYEAMEEGYYGS